LFERLDMHIRLTFVASLACGLAAARAGAQQLENPRTDFTAYTQPRGRLAAGPLKIEHGIIDEVMVGTFVPPWFAFPWLKVPVPNLYLKLRTTWWDPVTFSLRGSLAYIDAKAIAQLADEQANGSAVSITADLTASWRIDARYSVSLGLDYAHLQATGQTTSEATSVEGASVANTYSVRAFGEWRLTRVFALTLLFRYLVYQSPIRASVDSRSRTITTSGDLSAETTMERRWTVVPGVSFAWPRWELSAGVGYGLFYLPVLGLASSKALPDVEFAFAFFFDLY
jgi:hypothetical protein